MTRSLALMMISLAENIVKRLTHTHTHTLTCSRLTHAEQEKENDSECEEHGPFFFLSR